MRANAESSAEEIIILWMLTSIPESDYVTAKLIIIVIYEDFLQVIQFSGDQLMIMDLFSISYDGYEK